jgi:hydroxypyruvate reductase
MEKVIMDDKITKLRKDAMEIFSASLKAVDPVAAVKRYLKLSESTLFAGDKSFTLENFDNIHLIGFGKAASSMARGVEEILGDRLAGGFINVKYGHLDKLSEKIEVQEAAHPVPNEDGVKGTEKIINFVKQLGKKDLIICVISGGGSALLPAPQTGITLEEKQQTTKELLACGADITEINAIRKHISAVKGGQLARLVYPATLITLILSDVIGDPLDSIASGPTAPDNSTFSQCLSVIRKYDLSGKIPQAVESHIRKGADGEIPETPKAGDAVFSKTHNIIVGSNWQAVSAAKEKAAGLGYNTLILSTFIEGETKDVARVHAAIAKEIHKTGNPIPRPACIISGGETTVTIRGNGKGGRNQEFVLAAAIDIADLPGTIILSGGTDGTDGPTDAAGAIADGSTIERAKNKQLDAFSFLQNNDSYHFFEKLDDLLITGPTNTNVMDLRLVIVG